MSFTEDADDFLNVDDFAVTANYNSGTTVTGIFSNGHAEVGEIETTHPTFVCELADVSGVNHGKSLTVNSTDYTVVGVQPDDVQFMVTLVLSED